MKYPRTDFKLSIDDSQTKFFINQEKGVVTCVIEAYLITPEIVRGPIAIYSEYFKARGVAKCHNDDIFDVERGKRIALAKAENAVYTKAIKFLNDQMFITNKYLDKIKTFINKGMKQCFHNNDYIESIHNTKHPLYKKNLNKLKIGHEE